MSTSPIVETALPIPPASTVTATVDTEDDDVALPLTKATEDVVAADQLRAPNSDQVEEQPPLQTKPSEQVDSGVKVSHQKGSRLFADSDSSDDELFKPKKVEAPKAAAPLPSDKKVNAKINSSALGTDSDESVLNSHSIPTPKKPVTSNPLLADSDSDGKHFSFFYVIKVLV